MHELETDWLRCALLWTARSWPLTRTGQAMQLFEEGLKEVEDLFSQRQEMLAEAEKG